MEQVLLIIGKTALFALIAFGFVQFVILEKIFKKKSATAYSKMKWWVAKITIVLCIIIFSCALVGFIFFLFQKVQ